MGSATEIQGMRQWASVYPTHCFHFTHDLSIDHMQYNPPEIECGVVNTANGMPTNREITPSAADRGSYRQPREGGADSSFKPRLSSKIEALSRCVAVFMPTPDIKQAGEMFVFKYISGNRRKSEFLALFLHDRLPSDLKFCQLTRHFILVECATGGYGVNRVQG